MGDLINLDNSNLPAHLQGRTVDNNDDLSAGASIGFPIISTMGKAWVLNTGGVSETYVNSEGDPRMTLSVIIVQANRDVSKVYYAGKWETGSTEAPDCYSNDGRTPALDVENKQSDTCALCPHSQWGSVVLEDGGKGKACGDFRRMAIIPAGDLDAPLHLMRVPPASLKALAQYAAALNKRQVSYNQVVTNISFDMDAPHAKFLFAATGYVDEAQDARVSELLGDDNLPVILGTTPAPQATVTEAADPSVAALDEAPKPKAKAKAKAKAKPKPAPEPVVEAVAEAPVETDGAVDDLFSELDDVLADFDD